ncbi:hypothetical protein JET18_04810 [Chryseobacterium sp. L7]|uniref:PRTase-CE domain-containing protein n=1 Tax=Chryseobacterium endalhagicum TaxID=2797638 RepID=A0ABS1QC05_9FLAO|nr:hypothetical protein [Chryseobacterium endalhagicum]MBL1220146.1 hypothetical protein [Chryseobacterium endalhagicum]
MDSEDAATYLLELDKIFEQKNWKQKENYVDVFNSLSKFSEKIIEDKSEYLLILELLREFHWISLNDYYNKCRALLINLISDLNHRNTNIYAFPIIKDKHQFKVKSGSFVSYLMKSLLETIPNGEKFKFEDINNFIDLKNLRFKKSDVFILVDDFIGSGETLHACIKEVNSINTLLVENLRILTIAIRKDTLDRINKKYKVYYNFNILKGITDYNVGEDIENKKQIMRKIENRIFLKFEQYSLGFQESESLITLLRTPDNTFPIFWNKYKKNIDTNPPFPRYEKA